MLNQTVSSITADGVSLTKIRSDTNGSYRTEIWYLTAPNVGSQTISISVSFICTVFATAINYWNVDQTSPIDANNGTTGTSDTASGSITTVASNTRVVGVACGDKTSGLMTNDAGQALRQNNYGGQGAGTSSEKGIILTGSSVSMSWSGLGGSSAWAVSFASLKPATTGDTISSQTSTGLARIQKAVDSTITGVSRVQKDVSATTTGLSRIQKDVAQTTTGVSRIQKSTSYTITGVARIQVTVDPWFGFFTGKARIQRSETATITGKARIQKSVDQTITGTARISTDVSDTLEGKARIQKDVSQALTGVSRIQKETSSTSTGKARIQKDVTSTEQGLARIQKSSTATITGKARIQKAVGQTISGTARITNDTVTTKTITGVASIYNPYVFQTITGVARIVRQDWYQDNPTPFETSASSDWYSDNPQSFKTNASNAWYEDASGIWETEDF